MAYSIYEGPKLHTTDSMKFYSEQYDHPSPVPCRHKTVSSGFNSKPLPYYGNNKNLEQKAHLCHTKKCPIYVHHFVHKNIPNLPSNTSRNNNVVIKNKDHRNILLNNIKHKPNVSLEKFEESYWASWKPSKIPTRYNKQIKSKRNNNNDVENGKLIQYTNNKTHIKTDNSQHLIKFEAEKSKTRLNEIQTNSQENQTEFNNSTESKGKETETEIQTNILKHTDSFILTAKKQHGNKEKRFEQPKCIRLYKKAECTTSNYYIKCGSYPLKSCLKTESMFSNGNIRLGPPLGSSLIVTTSGYSRNYKK